MQYLLLIYDAEGDWAKMSDAERGAVFEEYKTFSADLGKSGKLRNGNALKPVSTATTVRVREGKTLLTDGPFAETREQLGGYYLIDAADLDEAVAIAKRIPSARIGCIEVRPIMDFG